MASAQKDVDDTVLRATADGTIAALNGAVGEVLAPSAGTTPLAPGSTGAIPGAGTSLNAAAGTVDRPGGTQFLVLDNVDTFEVVVPFEESDAVRVSPDQRVDVRFDAVPDLTLPGNVVAVSPSASALSGVISYYVTVGLSQSDPRLRNGQTAQASVVTSELRDVLAVPNTAIRRQGGRTQVTVQRFDGEQVVDITPGVVGDTTRRCSRGCRRATRSRARTVADQSGTGRGGGDDVEPNDEPPRRDRDGPTGPRADGAGSNGAGSTAPPRPTSRRPPWAEAVHEVALLIILVTPCSPAGCRRELLPGRAQLRHHGQRPGRRREDRGRRAGQRDADRLARRTRGPS